MANKYLSLKERFWSRVKKTKKCWIWIGANNGNRGQLSVNGRLEVANRISFILHYGEIPRGLFVCHKCDNSMCVRPDHLFLGTQKDNMQDALRKGRIYNSARTHCKHGHKYTAYNTYMRPNGHRLCAACNKIRKQKYKLQQALQDIKEGK